MSIKRYLSALLILALCSNPALAQKSWVDDSGTWRQDQKIWVNDSGTWREAQKVWKNDSGTWRQVFANAFTFSPAAIAVDRKDYVLTTEATNAGWNGTSPLIATITVNSGVAIGSSSTSSAAFTVGSLPAGSTVTITNNGYIIGKGGNGGASDVGENAGTAFSIAYATTVNNTSGTVGGGGGGGGSSGPGGGGSGGGAGYDVGIATGGFNDGNDGTRTTGGLGGGGDPCGPTGAGGNGGNLGAAGQSSAYAGGAAGACKTGAGAITVNGGSKFGSGC